MTRLTIKEVELLPPLDDIEIVPSVEPIDVMTGAIAEIPVAIEEAPKGTLVIDKHMPVEAADGHAGSVDAVLIDPVNGALTHIILREGHFWAKKDVTLPIENVSAIGHNAVTLNVSKEQIGQLPSTPA
jgi:hypothetical protein